MLAFADCKSPFCYWTHLPTAESSIRQLVCCRRFICLFIQSFYLAIDCTAANWPTISPFSESRNPALWQGDQFTCLRFQISSTELIGLLWDYLSTWWLLRIRCPSIGDVWIVFRFNWGFVIDLAGFGEWIGWIRSECFSDDLFIWSVNGCWQILIFDFHFLTQGDGWFAWVLYLVQPVVFLYLSGAKLL
jgi:hypothetical protein